VTVLAPPARQKLSADFIAASCRNRILTGLASAIVASSYDESSIADIVRAAGCARKTFYRTFGSKRRAAIELLTDVCPPLGKEYADKDPASDALALLAVEITALFKVGRADKALSDIDRYGAVVEGLGQREIPEGDRSQGNPLNQALPPGRSHLSRDFVAANHRHRLLLAAADVVAECGYARTTVGHIVRLASVSRRSFYDHFETKDGIGAALLEVGQVEDVEPGSAVGWVAIEIIADRVGGSALAKARLERALDVLLKDLRGCSTDCRKCHSARHSTAPVPKEGES
jgi:AcrR family transcriptional regulator